MSSVSKLTLEKIHLFILYVNQGKERGRLMIYFKSTVVMAQIENE
jgi:hypothetical protein